MLGAHVRRAHDAGPVLAGDRAADLDRQLVEAVGELVGAAHLVRVLGVDKDRRMDVPVAEMAVEDDRDAELRAELARPPDGPRDLGQRHRQILAREDAVLARMREGGGGRHPAPRAPEALDLALVLGEARDGRATPDDRFGVPNVRGDLLGRALHLDEEDRLTLGESELGLPALDRLDRAPVEKLGGRGKHAGREKIVERRDGVLERGVAREDHRAGGRPRLHAQAKLREDAERPFGPDEELREVDAARRFERLRADAARRDDRAVGEHDLRAEDVRGRRAPADGVRAARVVRGHAAERARAPAAGIRREEETVRRERGLEVQVHEARLDDRLKIPTIDLVDLAHAREGDDDPALLGDRATRLSRAGAARDDGRAELVRELHDGDDLGRGLGDRDRRGHAATPERPERRVVRVREERRRVVDHAVAREHVAQAARERRVSDRHGARILGTSPCHPLTSVRPTSPRASRAGSASTIARRIASSARKRTHRAAASSSSEISSPSKGAPSRSDPPVPPARGSSSTSRRASSAARARPRVLPACPSAGSWKGRARCCASASRPVR